MKPIKNNHDPRIIPMVNLGQEYNFISLKHFLEKDQSEKNEKTQIEVYAKRRMRIKFNDRIVIIHKGDMLTLKKHGCCIIKIKSIKEALKIKAKNKSFNFSGEVIVLPNLDFFYSKTTEEFQKIKGIEKKKLVNPNSWILSMKERANKPNKAVKHDTPLSRIRKYHVA